jgi:hypothetical protein
MTKERARKRAKAKAGEKAKKRAAQAAQPDANMPSGKFDAGNNSIKKPGGGASNSNFAEARRGSARSR